MAVWFLQPGARVGAGLVGKLCFGEWRKLKRLRQVEDTQQTGQRLLGSMQMGEARDFIDGICKQMPKGPEQDRLQTLLNPEQNDAEQLQLFDQVVLTERDKVGMKLVRRYAAESAYCWRPARWRYWIWR